MKMGNASSKSPLPKSTAPATLISPETPVGNAAAPIDEERRKRLAAIEARLAADASRGLPQRRQEMRQKQQQQDINKAT